MIDYILDIAFDAADEERVQSQLFLANSTGSVETPSGVSAYFDSAEERAAAMARLGDLDLHPYEREREDWLARYEQSLEPLLIGASFVVAPDARLFPPGTTRHMLVVPQEQAFGTGSHETTSLCIELLESLQLAGKRGLDVGAGSGILALAMLNLGAEKVVAFDNDVDAYGALRDNRARNGVGAARMPLFIGSVEALRGGRFDVVTMNIVPEVIVPLLGDVVAHVGGTLILSGILCDRAGEVVRAAALHGLHLRQEREKGEWWAGAFVAPSS